MEPALTTTKTAPYAKRSNAVDRAAYDYNLSRSAVLNARPEGLTATVERVLSVVTGLWVALGDDECVPEKGLEGHVDGCAHRENLIPTTASDLARLTFGTSRGRGGYLERTKKAMDDLALWRGRARWPEDGLIRTGGILSTLSRDETKQSVAAIPGNRQFLIAFDEFLHRDLLAGHFQYIPVDAVQGLLGLDFKVYAAIVCGAGTWRLMQNDEEDQQEIVEYTITGPSPKLPVWRLGIGASASDDEIEKRLRDSIDNINRTQNALRLSLAERTNVGGWKIKVRDSKVPKRGLKGTQSGTKEYPNGDSKVPESRSKRLVKTDSRPIPDLDLRNSHNSSLRRMDRTGQKQMDDGRSRKDTMERVSAVLAKIWGRLPTERQLGLLATYASAHSPEWVLHTVENRPKGSDPLQFMKAQHRASEEALGEVRQDDLPVVERLREVWGRPPTKNELRSVKGMSGLYGSNGMARIVDDLGDMSPADDLTVFLWGKHAEYQAASRSGRVAWLEEQQITQGTDLT